MAHVTWNIFRLLWSWTPGFSRGLLKVWAFCPAPRLWRARARGVWHSLLHRVTFANPFSTLFRLQVQAWAATGTSLSLARSVRPLLYLLFRRIIR